MFQAPRKFFWFGLVFVFLIGLFGGAYLVLRSAVTHGELAASTPVSQGKTSDELLAELLELNQVEKSSLAGSAASEDKNLTETFFKDFLGEIGVSQRSLEKIQGSDFLTSTILPYLAANQPELRPVIPDSVLAIVADSKTNAQKYFKDSEPQVIVFFNAVKALTQINPEDISETETLNELAGHQYALAEAFAVLSRQDVPKKYLTLHKDVLTSVYSLQKILESMASSGEDPLKALIAVNNLEALGDFWKDTLTNYDRALKIK